MKTIEEIYSEVLEAGKECKHQAGFERSRVDETPSAGNKETAAIVRCTSCKKVLQEIRERRTDSGTERRVEVNDPIYHYLYTEGGALETLRAVWRKVGIEY